MKTNLPLLLLLVLAIHSSQGSYWPFGPSASHHPKESSGYNLLNIHSHSMDNSTPHKNPTETSQSSSEPTTASSEDIPEDFAEEKNYFGGKTYTRELFTGSESIVHLPENGLFSEDEHYQQHYDTLISKEMNPEEHERIKNEALISCAGTTDRPDFLKLAPIFVNSLTPESPSFSWEAPCFTETQISLNVVDDKTVQIIHVNKKPANLLCTDAYFYSMYTNFHVKVFSTSGTHKITLKVSPQQLSQIATTGIQVFRVCDKTINIIPDLYKSLTLFLGGFGLNPNIPFFGSKPTEFQERQNVKFLEDSMAVTWEKRPHDVVVDLDESLIQSGDFLAIIRFDGLDPIIGYGSGSTVGHSTMALRVGGELFVVESQSGWYWPRSGIQINPYKQWIQWARNAGFHVTLLQLKKEVAAQFDSEAAYAAFKALEGTPYGYHNFLFGWIDTAQHSCPTLLSPEFLGAVFAIVERVSPSAANSVYNLALNRRLGTENLTVPELAAEAASRNLTLPDLYAMVEDDAWKYPDGYSLVCSSFVIAMWKAGGLFGNYSVNATEFTPRDIYQLDFIDPNPVVPENCKEVDPTNTYCQIMGKYRMFFPGISTVSPYDHMNENCWAVGPEFARYPEGC